MYDHYVMKRLKDGNFLQVVNIKCKLLTNLNSINEGETKTT